VTEQELAFMLGIKTPSPIQIITPNWQGIEHYQLSVKRDDLIHPIISGNKWRKLKYALLDAVQSNTQHIISFGGGFSNHLHALGYCCSKLNIKFTAIIRGDYSNSPSPMLKDLTKWQTQIHYVDRLTYQQKAESIYLDNLSTCYPDAMIIPEGGSQSSALKGSGEIINEIEGHYDSVIIPVGSGGTLAGLITNIPINIRLLGVGVLKGEGYLESLVQALLPNTLKKQGNWSIEHNFHFGGYGKCTSELSEFCQQFAEETSIDLEPVYSGKLFFAIKALINSQNVALGRSILAIHTGGLQGAR
jgi:1-aminocyclopropane-1-carboxylate deaminase